MKISARNQLSGTVRSVTEGSVMAEVVVVDVSDGRQLVAANHRRVRPPARSGPRQDGRCHHQVDRGDTRPR